MTITKEIAKQFRNNFLIESDLLIAEADDPAEISRWMTYRQQLRDFFDDKPDDYDYEKVAWPRSPRDIDALYEKAAAGDEEAKQIIERDGL